MSNNNLEATVRIEECEDEDTPDDFSFVLGPEGELKSFAIPEHMIDDLPESVEMILKLFGIDDLTDIENRTLH